MEGGDKCYASFRSFRGRRSRKTRKYAHVGFPLRFTDLCIFTDILKTSLGSLTIVIPTLTSQIESILIRRCCDTLTPVKTIAGQFRATSQKNLPTKPSSFVPLILRPIKLLFGIDSGEGRAKALKEEFCASISTSVVDAVANK